MGVEDKVKKYDRMPSVSHYDPHLPQYLDIPVIRKPLDDDGMYELMTPFPVLKRLCARLL
jgi:hypothetical protein